MNFFKKQKQSRRFFKAYCPGWTNVTYSKAQMYVYWCSSHFNTPFCVILQYPQSKKCFMWKRKTILSQAAWFSFRILCRLDIYFKRLIIYQSGITMNISNTWSFIVLSNLELNLISSVLQKSWKNDICPSEMCLSDIITSSRISLIIFFVEDFFSHNKIESYPSIHITLKNKKNYILLSNLDRIRASALFI